MHFYYCCLIFILSVMTQTARYYITLHVPRLYFRLQLIVLSLLLKVEPDFSGHFKILLSFLLQLEKFYWGQE